MHKFLILLQNLVMPTGTSTNEVNTEIETTTDNRNQYQKMFKVI